MNTLLPEVHDYPQCIQTHTHTFFGELKRVVAYELSLLGHAYERRFVALWW